MERKRRGSITLIAGDGILMSIGEFPGVWESTNLSRDNLSRETGRRKVRAREKRSREEPGVRLAEHPQKDIYIYIYTHTHLYIHTYISMYTYIYIYV